MRKIEKLWLYFLGLPKTIYFNLRYFSFLQAIKLPVLISHRVKLKSTKGKLQIVPRGAFSVKIGFGYVGVFDSERSRSIWDCRGNVVFHGTACIGHGSKISVGPEGTLEIGNNFNITAESTIICFEKIKFGENVLISWQCLIMDTDFHKILINNQVTNSNREICIGDHVWIGCRCTILKGVKIASGCVIASGSHLVKSVNVNKVIVGGNPAQIIRKDIDWIG